LNPGASRSRILGCLTYRDRFRGFELIFDDSLVRQLRRHRVDAPPLPKSVREESDLVWLEPEPRQWLHQLLFLVRKVG
jgi:hypothetical protein